MNPRRFLAGVAALIILAALSGPAPAAAAADVGISMPPARAAFPHELHVVENEIECSTCHVGTDNPEEKVTAPSPEVCADCHDPQDVAAYFPVGAFHREDWLQTHAMEARSGSDRCTTCHEGSDTCAMCHDGENIDILTHPRNWVFLHSIEARHGETDCKSCHSSEQFCSDCHQMEQVQPTSHQQGGWRRGAVHGGEARRDPTYCASCHAGKEPVCLDCHARP